MALITCEHLSLGYEGREIIHDLNFEVNAGDYLCIVGENGAGKSTLMRTLLGLRAPMSGEVKFGEGLVQTELGWLPQQTEVQRDFPASVREIVLSGCQGRAGTRSFYDREDKRRTAETMEKLGLTRLSRRCYRELSGGQQQRVLLARALCAAGKLLLLDEPAAGLDPLVTADMYKLIDGLHREGVSILMVSHDVHVALRYATHILHVGANTFFGTRDDYRRSAIGRNYLSLQHGETT